MRLRHILRITQYTVVAMATAVLLYSCANRGQGPQGGPKDETPPVMLECSPQEGAVNVDTLLKRGIKMEFNENMAIKDAYKYVFISPPSKFKPNVKAQGKDVITTFEDTLRDNTTYTIYYGNALTDNNEGNPIKNYSYVFSTGETLDTLYIDGYIINARTLAPEIGIVAGVYPDAADTTFTTTKFFRVAKTDSTGYFRIENIPDNEYSLFALNDAGGDWYYSQKAGGTVGFWSEKVRPQKESNLMVQMKNDTVLVDSLTMDSLKNRKEMVIKLFTEKKTQQYFKKAMHPNRQMFILVFGSEPSMLPKLRVLPSSVMPPPFLLEPPAPERRDSLVYWVTDTTLLQNDTLRLEMTYLATDSLNQLTERTDTLNLRVPKKRAAAAAKKKKKDDEPEPEKKIEFLNMTHNFKEKMEVTDTITISFAEPVESILFDSITLALKVDTLLEPVPVTFETGDSLCNKELRVIFEKQFGETYKFNIDSAAIVSIYGHHNNKFYKTFTIKKLEEYANLYITFPENPADAVFELMDNKEKVLYRAVLEGGEVSFQDIQPGTYYLRMFIDSNHNGVWDTGNVSEHLQPEDVFYMNQTLSLPANWDVEQVWDYKSFNILNQRPADLNKKK